MRNFIKLIAITFLTIALLISGKESAEAAFNPYRPLCVGIQGKFTAKNWKGGPIQVGCAGDDGGATRNRDQRCTGEVQTVYPGKSFRLTKCSCFGSNKGCLRVGKELKREPLVNGKRRITVVRKIQDMQVFKNNSCTINDISKVCGANGAKIEGNVRIKCQPGVTITNTPTPTEPDVTECPGPEKVTNVRVKCPNCEAQQDN
jgi:hypothetical protein